MLRIRTTKTASGNTGVQVVYRHHQKTEVVKHIGTATSQQEEKQLRELAAHFIATNDRIPPLLPGVFTPQTEPHQFVSVAHLSFTKTYHTFAYEFLSQFYAVNGFTKVTNNLLRDLSFMRIIEPASKIRSIELFNKYFGKTYTQNMLYKGLPAIPLLQESVETIAVSYAKEHLGFDFSLVFYDVTTLYFETFHADEDIPLEAKKKTLLADRQEEASDAEKNNAKIPREKRAEQEAAKGENNQQQKEDILPGLRKQGFSKDNKPLQPQIVIGLIVNKDGYPIAVELFSGNTFEGHTMIPVIQKLQKKYAIQTLTIVADAGMLSVDNIDAIKEAEFHYIVGARMGNAPTALLKEIAQNLNKTENRYYKKETDKGLFICDYSAKRATKDRSDRKKQLKRAQEQIDNPEKIKRRIRFVQEKTKSKTKTTLKLNQQLIEKDELKEGIKGYYTNLPITEKLTEKEIIARYKDLWHVEKSFRIAKSDLEARPIFHHKRESIQAHILIVFVSLCLAKSIEMKTGYSIKKVRDMIWDILDIECVDTLTNRTFLKRMETIGNPMAAFLEKLKRGEDLKS